MLHPHTPADLSALHTSFVSPGADAAPMMRWWWSGPAVTAEMITRDLDAMKDAGIGGVELAVTYPLTDESDTYLSPTMLADVRFAAEQARERAMRFDLTLGSGWSFGGPHISPANAARKLAWDRREIGLLPVSFPASAPWPGDEFIAAFVGDGSLQEVPADYTPLTVVDGTVIVPAGLGPRVVLVVTSRLTGQQVKRAAAGAEGLVLDHYSAAATQAHITGVCAPLLDAVPSELIESVFCDSLESYSADWTPAIVAEFSRRRGYDLLPVLFHLHGTSDAGASVRADYFRTLTELYEENFVVPLQEFSASRGVDFRIQGYGEPPAGISSYRFADRFEGEGWGWKDLTQSRWASSAAHLYGKNVVSSEVWTWIHSPSFRATPMDMRGEAHEHALIGINHFIGHGWPCVDRAEEGLGWVFYAAGALDDRNPWWPAMPSLSLYLHRLSWLLRQGNPVADVGLYAPSRDAYAAMRSDTESTINLWHNTRLAIGDDLTAAIREAGFDFDAWDDDALEIALERYPVIVLPRVSDIPEETARALTMYRERGGIVIAVGGDESIPASARVDDSSGLGNALTAALAPALTLPHADLGFVQRRLDETTTLWFIANTGPEKIAGALSPRETFTAAEEWNLSSGARTALPVSATINVSLEPYEAIVFVTSATTPGSAPETVDHGIAHALQAWTLAGTDAAVTAPHRWEDDPETRDYSGTVSYETTIDLASDDALLSAPNACIDFGDAVRTAAGEDAEVGIRGRSYRVGVTPPVGEVAEVDVNGVRAGVVWGTPYRVAVAGLLRAGTNTITVRVSNTLGNALAVDPTVVAKAEATTAQWGRRFRMQNFDIAAEGVSSGLLTVPTLRA